MDSFPDLTATDVYLEDASSPSKRQRNAQVVVQNPTLDLDTYIAGYEGRAKIGRLIFIASRCPPLAADAYKAALALIKDETLDSALYLDIAARFNAHLADAGLPPAEIDSAWVEDAQRQARTGASKLEAEVKSYKANSIKESIRMGYTDLGNHYYKCGAMSDAVQAFSRAREYASDPKLAVGVTVQLAQCYLQLGQYNPLQVQVSKLAGMVSDKSNAPTHSLVRVFRALTALRDTQFAEVAKELAQLQLADTADHITQVMTAADVAVVTVLCALATYSRSQLKALIENSSFRSFLELDPPIRDTLLHFYHSKYAKCLELLAQYRDDRLLDTYLSQHVETLYKKIRDRALVQYCSPFSSVHLPKMAAVFACNVDALEAELVGLIENRVLDARIDSHGKILRAKHTDERMRAFRNALDYGDQLALTQHQAMLKMSLIHHGLAVVPAKGNSGGGQGGSGGNARDIQREFFAAGLAGGPFMDSAGSIGALSDEDAMMG
ncbi:hypothetical protein H9P43_001374 [Blastocladiella emersonii ATCC 22665]|nr:hypothetical protein H9P43_001374 [Blastocladiella emersonii ATCC 22665]